MRGNLCCFETQIGIIDVKEFKFSFPLHKISTKRLMRILGTLIFLLIIATGCNNPPPRKVIDINDGYISKERENCDDKIAVNGKWRLIKTLNSKNDSLPFPNLTIVIKDCSIIEYYRSDVLVNKENFMLYRELKYCDDYQMLFTKNDSATCINFFKDTMELGACSSYETSDANKYFFKRIN
jgi:hypothetical protein